MKQEKKHIEARIHGKVQGVFFRASTQEKAEELGLTGYVLNERGGTVYLTAADESHGGFESLCEAFPVCNRTFEVRWLTNCGDVRR